MAARLIDGNALASLKKTEIAQKVKERAAQGKPIPHLAAILVGNDPASESYVKFKVKDCAEIGFSSTLLRFPSQIAENELLKEIQNLNENPDIHGFIVQLPLPAHIHENRILTAISPAKDVDGFHPENAGRLMLGLPGYTAATPWGIMQMLEHYQVETSGKHAVVIGRSNIVGTPLSVLLSRNAPFANASVTLLHSRSQNIDAITRQADILISAVGKPGLVRADMVKTGAVVIDVGTSRVDDPTHPRGWRLSGDVDFESVKEVASLITPVPGGVGPMTRIGLLHNTLLAAEKQFYP